MASSNPVASALKDVLPGYDGPMPQELVTLAGNYSSLAQRKISGLKPDEEAARPIVCAHLAVEKLAGSLKLPAPSGDRAPVQPKIFHRLLDMFRNVLIKGGDQTSPMKISPAKNSPRKMGDAPMTPSKKPRRIGALTPSRGGTTTPSKTPSRTPAKTPSRSAAKRSLDDDEFDDDDGSPAPTTPAKQRRGLAKKTDPKAESVERIAAILGLTAETTDAIAYGYRQYNNLVRDRWALLGGLIYVVTSKAQPELIESPRVFEHLILRLIPAKVSLAALEEWAHWAERNVADQSWVRKITSPHVKLVNVKNKTSSGVGNMITYSLMFSASRKLEGYDIWKRDVLRRIGEAQS